MSDEIRAALTEMVVDLAAPLTDCGKAGAADRAMVRLLALLLEEKP